MAFRSFEVACENGLCEGRGARITTLLNVESRSELPSGSLVEDICRRCGEQLRVQLSAPSISGSGSAESNFRWCGVDRPGSGHRVFLGPHTDRPMFEICHNTHQLQVDPGVVSAEMQVVVDPDGERAN